MQSRNIDRDIPGAIKEAHTYYSIESGIYIIIFAYMSTTKVYPDLADIIGLMINPNAQSLVIAAIALLISFIINLFVTAVFAQVIEILGLYPLFTY